MSSTLENFPALCKAFITLACDNGALHRGTTKERLLDDAGRALLVSAFTAEQITQVDAELGALSEGQLLTMVCGEEGEARAIGSTLAHELIDYLFEAL